MPPKRQIKAKTTVLLFGEGKTEGIFLEYLKRLYQSKLPTKKITTDQGEGGGPNSVARELERRHLAIASYDHILLWLDEDLPLKAAFLANLKSKNITVLLSSPRCIEGFFLELLDDCPAGAAASTSAKLKSRFNKNHLATDNSREALRRLRKGKISELFPLEFLEHKRSSNQLLKNILDFLEV